MKKILIMLTAVLLGIFSCDNSTGPESKSLVLKFELTQVSGYGDADGSINLTVTGGSKPYQYLWSNGKVTEDISYLKAGTYSVQVTDSDSRTKTDSVSITQPANPLLGRTYSTNVPSSYTGTSAVPLVIALHNYGSSSSEFELYTSFSLVSDTAGFIVVYPDATGDPSEWNAGIGLTPSTLNVDDVAFISELIDVTTAGYNIDTNRVYIAGFSNASIMTHKLASELSSKVCAAAAVAGQATSRILNSMNPEQPVAMIIFNMLDDLSLSYSGGVINGVSYPSAENVVSKWRSINNCQSQPEIIYQEYASIGYKWKSADSYADVVFYKLAAGGHTWPESPLFATEVIWRFFKNHAR